ncbi:OprD family outer membrane porin [Pseudomonas sp. Teo4]|uniref:OprD family outer membrane porin n=1 Tax=Pseudomonas sp. Teo4 TaxID=3064528 RepID=UPI002AB83A5A|nr:OprD family outer membrane porin [Pseudomonas sp. Teo4]MDZ3992411.1 Porin D [Pseudomonas sp. Teo4]
MHSRHALLHCTAGSLAAFFTLAPLASQAAGFLEDSSLTLNTRQWYSHEIGRKDTRFQATTHEGKRAVRDRTAWLQGAKLDYVSGFSQGPVGFGLDLSLYGAVALERSRLATAGGSNRLLVDKDGNVVDDWSKVGVAAAKFKVADTVMKVGRHQVRTPVMGYSDTRTLPASFDGWSLESQDIDNLTLKAGYFDRATPRTGAGSQDLGLSFVSRQVNSDWVAYLGGDYSYAQGSKVSLYGSRFEDIWDREYLGLTHKHIWSPQSASEVQVDFYNTRSSGRELAGKIDQQAYGLSLTQTWLNHSLKFGVQQIVGDEYFDYVAESNAINLPNTMLSYYNGPNERSFQINYVNDFAAYGFPGFKTILWYIKGWGIDGSHYDGGRNAAYGSVLRQDGESHYEVGTFVSYVFQSGSLKGASVLTGNAWHRASDRQIEGNLEEFRLIFNKPFKIL